VRLHTVRIQPTFDAWRAAARGLLLTELPPERVSWETSEDAQGSLLDDDAPPEAPGPVGRIPRAFFPLAEAAACHSDPERWALLYRVLWRITRGERHLLEIASDPDTHRLLSMEKAVRRASHKMKAFVRFRGLTEENGETRYVAWFDPVHHVVERTAPFFVDRFPSMRWSILTPSRCIHWDGAALEISAGVPRSHAPAADALEALWRTYYGSTFNPARLRTAAMRAEMPIRYWRDLPESQLIAPLVRDASERVQRMVRQANRRTGEQALD
jgi:uracil-DNA glycosylase